MGGIAAIHSEWHLSLIRMGSIVPQISQLFAVVSSLLPEDKFRYKLHQPRSCFWNMSASLILSDTTGSASWVLLIYHLISPKGNMQPELPLCSGSAYVCSLQVMFTSMDVREKLSQSSLNLLLSSQ